MMTQDHDHEQPTATAATDGSVAAAGDSAAAEGAVAPFAASTPAASALPGYEERWMSSKDAAVVMGFSVRKVEELIVAGDLRASLFGHLYRISNLAIRECMARHEYRPGSRQAKPWHPFRSARAETHGEATP